MQTEPFNERVGSRYGAPMGRASRTPWDGDEGVKLRLAQVPLNSGGYDAGGAYWGHGTPLYCAWDAAPGGRFLAYVRASSRAAAARAFEGVVGDALTWTRRA
jgi:hypothetical protein